MNREQAPETPEHTSPVAQSEIRELKPQGPASDTLGDVKQLGLFAAIASLSSVFWIVGAMEMVERLAFYGVKAVAALYATDAASNGGLGITATRFGLILTVWAAIQSFLPAFTGGLSDRYGYKETIFVSTVVKLAGYIVMAAFPNEWGFIGGAVLLATGTAIFKPGIQGTLVNSTTRQNSSMAWGIFYQTVNIGGFIGPLIAIRLQQEISWTMVFIVCAGAICANFLLLLTYKEPKKAQRLARAEADADSGKEKKSLFKDSMHELAKPHVWVYLVLFSGFWFMFMSLFDVLPLHIRDWVNTSAIISDIFGAGGTQNGFFKFIFGTNEAGTEVNAAGLLNLNAGLIMVTCFFFAWLSGLMRATTSMMLGCLMATGAMFMSGYSSLGWFSVAAILVFSVGEMLSSPKFSEFIGNIAPHDKKAMYLGFSQIPVGLGWTLEAAIAPALYDHMGSKERFARELLVERGMATAEAAEIPQGEAFNKAVVWLDMTPEQVTDVLYATHNVGALWLIMGGVGIVSAVGIYIYGRWVRHLSLGESAAA